MDDKGKWRKVWGQHPLDASPSQTELDVAKAMEAGKEKLRIHYKRIDKASAAAAKASSASTAKAKAKSKELAEESRRKVNAKAKGKGKGKAKGKGK